MSDPLARSGKEPPSLFNQPKPPPPANRGGQALPARGGQTLTDTSAAAGAIAARCSGQRYARILQILADRGPLTLFELAAEMGVFDHQISGRITELKRDGWIEPTGETRIKPGTGASAQVLRLREQPALTHADALAEALGYPPELIIEGEAFQRFPTSDDPAPGIPYRRRTDRGGVALIYRLDLIACPGCGRHLKMIVEGGSKVFRCGTKGCNRTWHIQRVRAPGGPDVPALVATHL